MPDATLKLKKKKFKICHYSLKKKKTYIHPRSPLINESFFEMVLFTE